MDADAKFADSLDLKVTELLKEVQFDYSSAFTKLVDDTVSSIKEVIDNIPENFQVTGDLAPGFVSDISADKVEFNFKKPKSVEIGGSYAIRCIAKPHATVDLLVRMPKECFNEKDYLNYRYHAKRCLYLCVIKKHLMSSSPIQKVEWSTLQNEARKPVLVVYPVKTLADVPGFFVRIIPTATSLFNVSKLNLKRNNVRALNQGGDPLPTPKYNSSILEDMFIENNAELLKKNFLGWKELREALILLKIWARQRSSIYSYDCLNGFIISILLSYLATQDKINCSLKAFDIFRVGLDFIATSKLWERGLYFPPQDQNRVPKEEKKQQRESFPVVICDSSTHMNLAFRMTRIGFLELQDEAALTLKCMTNCRDGGFEEIFTMKIDYPAKYDYCIRLNLRENRQVYASGFCLDDECWRLYEQKVHNLLCQGLGDRAKLIRVIWRNSIAEWNVEDGLSTLDRSPLLVGISISSIEKAFRVVDIGQNAENKEEALKFRRFWGEKAELRRFKDGTIAESTVWETEQWSRHLILKKIVEYVLLRHLSLSKENIVQIVDQLDFSLIYGAKDPVSCSGALIGAFELLSKRLRLIDDIPLGVSSVQPLDSAFRFTSVFPPEPHPLAREKVDTSRLHKLPQSCIQALDVMIQLEGSGNWPMDDLAIEKTKSAFLLKIAESLQNSWGITCSATEDNVVVFMSGYAFCLKIWHERGLNLVKKETGNGPVKRVPSMDRKLFLCSQHASMINGLQGRYPVYGPVVRLAKRWVSSHLFSACLAEEAIELLVAYLFLKPFPFTVPCSRITGFLRFLRLLAEYDWTFSPLVVDINNDLSRNDEKEINDNFMSSRKANEENKQNINAPMFLTTSYDKASEAWTSFSPNSLELKRLVAYARSSTNLLSNLVLHDQSDSYGWECLFRTPLNNYDAIILLHRDKLPYPQRLLFPSELNQGSHVAHGKASKSFHHFILPGDLKTSSEELKSKLMVNFDPLMSFAGDLEKEFITLKLWYDSLGGDAIGLTWDGTYSKKRERDEEGGEGKYPIDVLKAVGEIGKGFVREIYLLKAPRLMK
ncbi:LOW QUALITY PROTEIN: nucleolar protein 6 [Carica papaya]|uniref:LOW QUALITY PROTEIN: nucleolar protein 6 n=1 Tax=Carica papaya TaxID=3649 RepID=UPI000B8CB9CA|nr:LOW QUALITY PROTEIN: nucleolar protein 6 [Carica papaya]